MVNEKSFMFKLYYVYCIKYCIKQLCYIINKKKSLAGLGTKVTKVTKYFMAFLIIKYTISSISNKFKVNIKASNGEVTPILTDIYIYIYIYKNVYAKKI